jgi:hypothetical protein
MRPTRDMTRIDEPFRAPARPSEVNVTMRERSIVDGTTHMLCAAAGNARNSRGRWHPAPANNDRKSVIVTEYNRRFDHARLADFGISRK